MNKFTLDKAGNYGEVRSVNGIKPDENGNVEAGGNILHVKFFRHNDDTYTCSHTYKEIIDTFNATCCFVYATEHIVNDGVYDPKPVYGSPCYMFCGERYLDDDFIEFKHPNRSNNSSTFTLYIGGAVTKD